MRVDSQALLLFNALAVVSTVLGGTVHFFRDLLSRKGVWRLLSLRAGLLLAATFTEILPEAWKSQPTLAGWGALAAFTALFAMESYSMLDTCPEYVEECDVHLLGWTAMAALLVHSFIDGFNLTVSFRAGTVAGVAIGIALALHKLADGFTLTTLLHQSGYDRKQVRWGLIAVSCATPLGSLASAAGLAGLNHGVSAALLGFAGGSFLYIGAADVLRRIHRAQDRLCLLYFGIGLFGMAALQAF